MEATHKSTRWYRVLCWLTLAVCLAGFLFVVVMGGHAVHRCIERGKPFAAVVIGLFGVAVAGQLALLTAKAVPLLRFSVRTTDEAIRVGQTTVPWSEVESIEHPKRTIGLAFLIWTRDGRKLEVYSGIERARELEDLVRSRLAARASDG